MREELISGFLVLKSDVLISAVMVIGGSSGPVSFRQAALIPFRKHGSTISPIYISMLCSSDLDTYQGEEDPSTTVEEIVQAVQMELTSSMDPTDIRDM